MGGPLQKKTATAKYWLGFYNVTQLASVAMLFSLPFCHIQAHYENHLQSSFCSAS